MTPRFESLSGLLASHAGAHPDRVTVGFLSGARREQLTYHQLAMLARGTAERLREHADYGDRVLLALHSGPATIAAFFACQYAGLIPVFVMPPGRGNERMGSRMQGIGRVARPRIALVDDPIAEDVCRQFVKTLQVESIRCEGTSVLPLASSHPTAFLQFTSGSTREPRGVVVPQTAVMANLAIIEEAFGHDESCMCVHWLPLHHDMGLVGSLLQPMYVGFPTYIMPSRSFLISPFEWLKAVTQLKVTTTGGPTFGFEQCVQRVTDAQLAELDLSTLRVLYCGSEPIRPEVIEAFVHRFAKAGLNPRAIYPCYGLAESALFVSGVLPGRGLVTRTLSEGQRAVDDGVTMLLPGRLASCGQKRQDTEIRIVDTARAEAVGDGEVGEIWVRGSSVAAGYFENPESTAEVFGGRLANGDGPFLRTGDLGMMDQGDLYVVGRRKDVLIVDGIKYVANDIESTVRLASNGKVASVMATELPDEGARGGIALWLGVDTAVQKHTALAVLGEELRQAAVASFGVPILRMAIYANKAFLRTTSGKLERAATLRAFRESPPRAYAWYDVRDGWHRACDVWRFVPIARPSAAIRLYVFGAAGVGASSYSQLARALPPSIEFVAVQYPGRESRRNEPPLTTIGPMVDALEQSFLQWGPQRTVLFGHSMGGRIVIELARRLVRNGRAPEGIVLAACSEPKTTPEEARAGYALPPEQFEAYARSFGVIPKQVGDKGALSEELLTLLRADFELHDTTIDCEGDTLDVRALLLVGRGDPVVRPENMAPWGRYFAGRPTTVQIDGGHFFPQDAPEATANSLIGFVQDLGLARNVQTEEAYSA